MTTQAPAGARSDTVRDGPAPDVLFEEARRRRRRRWAAGSALTAAVAAAALIVGIAGGGGGGAGRGGHAQSPGSGAGAGSGHANASRLFPGAPSTQHYGVYGACPLAPRNRYLPPWSGCVTARVTDLAGDGRRDLVLVYSRLGHHGFGTGSGRAHALYQAKQAMLRVVNANGRVTTAPLEFTYTIAPAEKHRVRVGRVMAAAVIAIAHVSDEAGKEIFLQIGQTSSGSTGTAYSLYRGRLVGAGVFFGYGGDSATQAGFQCRAGNPPRLIVHSYELIRGIKAVRHRPGWWNVYGWWDETTVTDAWHGPRLVKIAQSSVRRRVLPRDTVGAGCLEGIG